MMMAPPGVKVHLALGVTDMRKGIDGLAMVVQSILKQDPFCGHLFAFRGRKANLMKILFWDGTGLCVSWSCCLSKAGPRLGCSFATGASHHRRAGSGGSRPPARR